LNRTKQKMALRDSDKYLNRYRIPSNRLKGWSYAQSGHYFITLVTHNREQLFGKIVEGKMVLSKIGEIVNAEFYKSFEMRQELYLGEYVIMPNHIHAIVILDNDPVSLSNDDNNENPVKPCGPIIKPREPKSISSFVAGFKSSAINRIDDWIDAVSVTNPDRGPGPGPVETHGRASLRPTPTPTPTQRTRERVQIQKFNKNNPLWQANYHDHIIRNELEYRRIAQYIIDNPMNWNNDTLSAINEK